MRSCVNPGKHVILMSPCSTVPQTGLSLEMDLDTKYSELLHVSEGQVCSFLGNPGVLQCSQISRHLPREHFREKPRPQ